MKNLNRGSLIGGAVLLLLFPLAAFARGDNPGNWPEPAKSDVWVLSVVYLVAKAGTGVAIDADTAAMGFTSKKACNDYAAGLLADMAGVGVKYSCRLVRVEK